MKKIFVLLICIAPLAIDGASGAQTTGSKIKNDLAVTVGFVIRDQDNKVHNELSVGPGKIYVFPGKIKGVGSVTIGNSRHKGMSMSLENEAADDLFAGKHYLSFMIVEGGMYNTVIKMGSPKETAAKSQPEQKQGAAQQAEPENFVQCKAQLRKAREDLVAAQERIKQLEAQ